ncbi:MAG: Ig-like domain-containing protein [Gemmatimonadaceae bacterium]|nr:Ig-like domain-containing protein [Gemmatimonadaceae bacterium]
MTKRPSLTSHSLATALVVVLGACSGSSEPTPIAASVVVTPDEATRLVGESVQLTATVKDAAGRVISKAVSWTSDRVDVATVNNDGLVTGLADGIATIRAAVDGKFGTAEVTVLGPCSTALAPTIAIGQTVNGSLTAADCLLNDGSYADGYGITVTVPTTVRIDMTSTAFDTWLVLLELMNDGSLQERAFNDDVDMNTTNSRIVYTLQPNLDYFILANSFERPAFGAYQLSVALNSAFAGRVIGPPVTKPGKGGFSGFRVRGSGFGLQGLRTADSPLPLYPEP